jgi:hypothetical protein
LAYLKVMAGMIIGFAIIGIPILLTAVSWAGGPYL